MSPQKPFDLTLDVMVEAEIADWLADREGGTTVEAEQMEFEEEDNGN